MLRTVLFAPEDLAIVKGDPAGRRDFLDDLLVARSPRYAAVHADYDRVLKQRNALLKSAGQCPACRAPSCGRSTSGTPTSRPPARALLAGRHELVEALRPLVDKSYAAVSRGGGPTRDRLPTSSVGDGRSPAPPTASCWRPRWPPRLRPSRDKELERGITLVGPHRDDLVLSLGGLPAKGYASHGESWSFALALRLAAYDLLRSRRRRAGADPRRRVRRARRRPGGASLAELVAPAEQVLITAAVAGRCARRSWPEPAGTSPAGR